MAPPPRPAFFVRAFAGNAPRGGKCLDFGPPPQVGGSPVFLFDCNGTVAQQIVVQEINDRHEVILRAGTKVLGMRETLMNTQGDPGTPPSEVPLELQNEENPAFALSLNQVFALDGDSIILAVNRDLVVQVQNGRGANRTPLVLGPRDLADSEFWEFSATDGSDRDPTSGFVRVSTALGLAQAVGQATWGAVIKVAPDASINVLAAELPPIGDGVTIRGDRRGTRLGPELFVWTPYGPQTLPERTGIFKFEEGGGGAHVRITGLRLRGPSRDRDVEPRLLDGIAARDDRVLIVDHNDLSDWPDAAVNVFGTRQTSCPDPSEALTGLGNVRIARNFIHHNEAWGTNGAGYGVVLSAGKATIRGNTFLMNRHAIASDGLPPTGYQAWFNLVLSNVPTYYPWHGPQQDFDMHGVNPVTGETTEGAVAGDYVDIAYNTFLGETRLNYSLRGIPCATHYFHDNFSRQDANDAIRSHHDWVPRWVGGHLAPGSVAPYVDVPQLMIFGNEFSKADPTSRLGTGDFDGDGRQDLFLATGTSWYFSPGGVAEWRYLNGGRTERVADLLFGDFDADGRTDVVAQHGRAFVVSWGGASKWEVLNGNRVGAVLGAVAVGNFVGDRRADLFYADGGQWLVADGGRGFFQLVGTSGFTVSELRFGNFDGDPDGRTDVLGHVEGAWKVSYSASSPWTLLRSALTDTVAPLVVADFDGNGRDDIATSQLVVDGFGNVKWDWVFSRDGIGDWTPLRRAAVPLTAAAGIARFSGGARADVLLWNDLALDIVRGGSGAAERYSGQEMR